MPLPCITKHGAKRCAALSKRTKLACGNLAAYGCKTCRYHGARKNILRGEQHPSYVHGNRTDVCKGSCKVDRYLHQVAWYAGNQGDIGIFV